MIEKPWGTIKCESISDRIQTETIHVVQAGHSSIHWHSKRDNLFWVIEGELQISIFARPPFPIITDVICIGPKDDAVCVPANVLHRFVAKTKVVCLEVYRAIPGEAIDTTDIHRISEGGISQGLVL